MHKNMDKWFITRIFYVSAKTFVGLDCFPISWEQIYSCNPNDVERLEVAINVATIQVIQGKEVWTVIMMKIVNSRMISALMMSITHSPQYSQRLFQDVLI